MYKVYRARVVSVEDFEYGDDRENRKAIYISPISLGGDAEEEYFAYPPSALPIDNLGSGVISYPAVGQECLVAEDLETRSVHILTYSVAPGTDQFGDYVEANVPNEGGIIFKVGGFENSILELNKAGKMRLWSNHFARLELDGTSHHLGLGSDTFRQDMFGGHVVANKSDAGDEATDYIWSFGRNYENPGFSDWERHDVEGSIGLPSPLVYVDKAVVRAGNLTNADDNTIVCGHVYELQTRQSTGVGEKDTTSSLRLGYQQEHVRWGDARVQAAGSMLDWRLKRNVGGSVGSMLLRYGLLEDNNRSGAGVPIETTAGEVYRLQVYQGENNDIAHGIPIFDSAGEGNGYDYIINKEDVDQQFTQSFGRLTELTDPYYNSVYRSHIHDNDVSLGLTEILGGSSVYDRAIVKDSITLEEKFTDNFIWKLETNSGSIYNKVEMQSTVATFNHWNASREMEVSLGDDELSVSRWRDGVTTSVLSFVDDEVLLKRADGDGTNIDSLSIKEDLVVAGNRSGSEVSLSGDSISAQSSGHTSGNNITIDGSKLRVAHGTGYIEVDNDSIVISSGTPASTITINSQGMEISTALGYTLTLDNAGLKCNGKALIFSTLLDWLASVSGTFGMGNLGGPVPMFPSTLAQFQVKNAIPVGPGTAVGFRSGN